MKIRLVVALAGLAISPALPTFAQQTNTPDPQLRPGNEMWWNGEWNVTVQGQTGDPTQAKGYWTSIVVRDGDAWRDRMQIWNVAPAPAK
jgi:hypothetical protein